MEVDQNSQGQGTPPGTPFDDGLTPSTTSADPAGSVRTENYFTPLYMEPQATDHTNVNTNQQSPTPEDTRDAHMATPAASEAVESDAVEAEAAAVNTA